MKFNPLFQLALPLATIGLAPLLAGTLAQPSASNGVAGTKQPVLGSRTAKILELSGLRFKDLNANGKLDPYEDWRLPTSKRVDNLLAQMSLEQKVGFMLISDTRLQNEPMMFGGGPPPKEPMTSNFNEEDLVQRSNPFTRVPLPAPVMNSAGTTKGVTQFHLRHFIFRANAGARMTAEWANKLQALCESQPLGIPALVTSNPRNHVTAAAAAGTSVGKTVFSTWPGELGLAAMRDLKLTQEFADMARQEWTAVGLRKGYMYMADIATEPRWQRVDGTFGENAEWAAQMTTAIVEGFQGKQLGPGSVAMTIKHFPGGGAAQQGQDPHFAFGKNEVFPGGKFDNNLLPFRAAIQAGTSSIMPYYSVPKDTKYEAVAYTYNKGILRDLLRGQLGFQGIINSDTGPIEMMPWGAEQRTIEQRYQQALEAGVNLFGGNAEPTQLLATVKSTGTDLALINDSVRRLLKEKFDLGLFENPYVDVEAAEKIVNSSAFQKQAAVALRKSVVLLRNRQLLPLKAKTKVYMETYRKPYGKADGTGGTLFEAPAGAYPVDFVRTAAEADVVLLWLQPTIKPLFASDGSPLEISLSKCAVNVEYVRQLVAQKPTILAINYTNPWVISEIYDDKAPGNIKGVLATFGTTPEALLDIVTGRFKPTGKMPFTTPISDDAVQKQKEDVPGYLEGPGYPLFKYDEGLTYPK
jgi:beta-glucosidase